MSEDTMEKTRAYGELALAHRGRVANANDEEREREMFLHLFHPKLEGRPELWEKRGRP